jgi:hypothetical protein
VYFFRSCWNTNPGRGQDGVTQDTTLSNLTNEGLTSCNELGWTKSTVLAWHTPSTTKQAYSIHSSACTNVACTTPPVTINQLCKSKYVSCTCMPLSTCVSTNCTLNDLTIHNPRNTNAIASQTPTPAICAPNAMLQPPARAPENSLTGSSGKLASNWCSVRHPNHASCREHRHLAYQQRHRSRPSSAATAHMYMAAVVLIQVPFSSFEPPARPS